MTTEAKRGVVIYIGGEGDTCIGCGFLNKWALGDGFACDALLSPGEYQGISIPVVNKVPMCRPVCAEAKARYDAMKTCKSCASYMNGRDCKGCSVSRRTHHSLPEVTP